MKNNPFNNTPNCDVDRICFNCADYLCRYRFYVCGVMCG